MNAFKVGDLVVSKRSGKVARVLNSGNFDSHVKFIESGASSTVYNENLELHVSSPSTPNYGKFKRALYSFNKSDGSIGYATYLATNSLGEWVVEECGNGVIYTLSKDKFEEVAEYTIKVRKYESREEVHFKGMKEGSVEVGDIIATNKNLYYVIELNTKSKTAINIKGRKIVTQPL